MKRLAALVVAFTVLVIGTPGCAGSGPQPKRPDMNLPEAQQVCLWLEELGKTSHSSEAQRCDDMLAPSPRGKTCVEKYSFYAKSDPPLVCLRCILHSDSCGWADEHCGGACR